MSLKNYTVPIILGGSLAVVLITIMIIAQRKTSDDVLANGKLIRQFLDRQTVNRNLLKENQVYMKEILKNCTNEGMVK